MQHIAIMRKSWGLTSKILDGQKTIESRWCKNRSAPWGQIAPGDTIYFKDSGEPIRLRATVERVLSFEGLTPGKVAEILNKYGKLDGLTRADIPRYYQLFKHKNYCLLIFLRDVVAVEPFDINKTGYGAMAAWLCAEDVQRLKI